jgi:hypothetical protein
MRKVTISSSMLALAAVLAVGACSKDANRDSTAGTSAGDVNNTSAGGGTVPGTTADSIRADSIRRDSIARASGTTGTGMTGTTDTTKKTKPY